MIVEYYDLTDIDGIDCINDLKSTNFILEKETDAVPIYRHYVIISGECYSIDCVYRCEDINPITTFRVGLKLC